MGYCGWYLNVRFDNLTLNGVAADMRLVRLAQPMSVGTTYFWPGGGQDWGESLIGITLNQPYVGLPSPMVDGLMSAIPGAAKWNRTSSEFKPQTFWSVPCDAKLDLNVTLNGTEFSMNSQDLIMREENGNCTALLYSVIEDGTWKSVPFLGLSFLRTVYSVWDLKDQRIGFMKVKDGGEVLNKTSSAPPSYAFSTVPVQATTTGKIYGEKTPSPAGVQPKGNEASPRGVASLTLAGASALVLLLLL